MGIANTIKDASDSEKLNAAIAGMDTVQVGISLFKSGGKLIPGIQGFVPHYLHSQAVKWRHSIHR
jgi:hypothetical protein